MRKIKPNNSFVISRILILLLFSFYTNAYCQEITIRGRVTDADKGTPLAFVNIIAGQDASGAMTDIDGYYVLKLKTYPDSLMLSYVGYSPLIYHTKNNETIISLCMKVSEINLGEVIVYAGENPAHRIVMQAIRKKDLNDPEKLSTWSYTSYSKFILTADSTELGQPNTSLNDSLIYYLNQYTEKQHFMIVESISERFYKFPDRTSERVLASRISGFSNPLFALVATQLQSFSIYPDFINISGKDFIGPLSKGSTSRYFFSIEDTLYNQQDSIFVISFKPAKGRNFEGLKGLLYINTSTYAVQNVIAEPAGQDANITYKIQQMYSKQASGHWFPVQLNTFIGIKNMEQNNIPMYGELRTYLSDIKINQPISNASFSGFDLEIPPDAKVRDEAFFSLYRNDSLSGKDLRTYYFLDSLGEKYHFDQTMNMFETLMTGYYPGRFFDIDLRRLVNFNRHEGFRLGLGLKTNTLLSSRFSLSGYFAYGFKDKATKYGLATEAVILKNNKLSIGANYSSDIRESGGSVFNEAYNLLGTSSIRGLYIDNMENISSWSVYCKGMIPEWKLNYELYGAKEQISLIGPYFFKEAFRSQTKTNDSTNFVFIEPGIRLRWSPWEKLISSGKTISSVTSGKPVFYLNYSQGIKDLLKGDMNYSRLELRIQGKIKTLRTGNLSWIMQSGIVMGDVPWSKLFTSPALSGRFSLSAPGTFATIGMNEFVSSKYCSVFLNHNVGPLWRNKKIKAPELLFKGAWLIGDLSNRSSHLNAPFQAPRKGIMELGLGFDKILRSSFSAIGIEAMYRFGYYSLPKPIDNLGIRFTFSINL